MQNGRHHGPTIFEAQPAFDAMSKQARYTENVDSIPEGARLTLEQYSNLEPEEVVPHVVTMVNLFMSRCPSEPTYLQHGIMTNIC